MQTVGQFDDNYTHILGHGQDHLTVVFHLPVFLGFILELFQLGHPIDQESYLLTKAFLKILFCIGSILYHIVKEGCHEGCLIHL